MKLSQIRQRIQLCMREIYEIIRFTFFLTGFIMHPKRKIFSHLVCQIWCHLLSSRGGVPFWVPDWDLLDHIATIDVGWLYVPLKNFSLIWRRHHCRWKAAKFRPMLGRSGLWAGRDLYRSTPAVTRDLGFSGLIRRTTPFSRLLRHTMGCGGSILTRILTGQSVGCSTGVMYPLSPFP
jgi:hypothetical protein